MEDRVNPALTDALRDMGRPTTPRKLQQRGVKRLRSIGMKEVSLLIERAINRTLIERTLGGDASDTAVLAKRAQAEFSRGLRVLEQLTDSQQAVREHRREMEQQLREMRKRLGFARGFVETQGWEGGEETLVSSKLREQLRGCLQPLVDEQAQAPAQARTVEGVVNDLTALVEFSLRDSIQSQRRAFEGEVQLLERRIRKLVESVEESERALERVSTEDVDPGVASIYRTVQGLGSSEKDRARKRDLMAALFKANLELRDKQ